MLAFHSRLRFVHLGFRMLVDGATLSPSWSQSTGPGRQGSCGKRSERSDTTGDTGSRRGLGTGVPSSTGWAKRGGASASARGVANVAAASGVVGDTGMVSVFPSGTRDIYGIPFSFPSPPSNTDLTMTPPPLSAMPWPLWSRGCCSFNGCAWNRRSASSLMS